MCLCARWNGIKYQNPISLTLRPCMSTVSLHLFNFIPKIFIYFFLQYLLFTHWINNALLLSDYYLFYFSFFYGFYGYLKGKFIHFVSPWRKKNSDLAVGWSSWFFFYRIFIFLFIPEGIVRSSDLEKGSMHNEFQHTKIPLFILVLFFFFSFFLIL